MENKSALTIRPIDQDVAAVNSVKARREAAGVSMAREAAEKVQASGEGSKPAPVADLRLVIEEVGTGRFVYKTVDRQTGEVISQLPREELVKLAADEDYQAGQIVSSRA